MVSWDYTNRNQAEGTGGKCVEHSPTIGCLVYIVLHNRVSTEGMMYVHVVHLLFGEASMAKDHSEWNARTLSKIIRHYRGVELPAGYPVKAKGQQGGRGVKGVSPTDVRPRRDGMSSIPEDATFRDVSYGTAPALMTVHVVGDGEVSK